MKFKQFLTEEIFDLKRKYVHFNKLLFNDELPDINLRYGISKRIGGSAKAIAMKKKSNSITRYNPNAGVESIKPTEIMISTFWDLDEDSFNGIFVHEMIHIYLYSKGIAYTSGNDRGHGTEFIQKLKELQKKVSFTIPETEVMDVRMSQDLQQKMFDIVLVDKPGWIGVVVFNGGYFDKGLDEVKQYYERVNAYTKHNELLLVRSDHPSLLQYRINRKMKRQMASQEMDKKIFDEIKKNGSIILTIAS